MLARDQSQPGGHVPTVVEVATIPDRGDDGCGGSCGSCGAGEACNVGQCMANCVPDCSHQECGTDGCGGSCGYCGSDYECLQGQCTYLGDNPSPPTGGNPPPLGSWQNPCPPGQIELYGDCVVPAAPPAGMNGTYTDAGCSVGQTRSQLGFWLLSTLFSCVWFLLRNEA